MEGRVVPLTDDLDREAGSENVLQCGVIFFNVVTATELSAAHVKCVYLTAHKVSIRIRFALEGEYEGVANARNVHPYVISITIKFS